MTFPVQTFESFETLQAAIVEYLKEKAPNFLLVPINDPVRRMVTWMVVAPEDQIWSARWYGLTLKTVQGVASPELANLLETQKGRAQLARGMIDLVMPPVSEEG